MSNVYIRSQNREKLYIFGISFNSLQYEEQHDYKRGKEAATHHTICIADGCLEEIAEYESKERCIEVLDEIEKVCSSYLYAAGSMGLIRGSTPTPPMATDIPRVYQMPERYGLRMDEYSEAVKEVYRVYRPLQKKHNLRMHSRFSIYDDGFIEIWEYIGEQRSKCVCKVKEEKDVECYKRATEELQNYGRE